MWAWIKKLFGLASKTGQAPVSPSLPSASTTVSTSAASATIYDERRLNTPNKSLRTIIPTMLVLHHTSGAYNGSVSWCMNPQSKVSYHCIIARDGRRTVLADDTARCWHAGLSSWDGVPDCNSYSLGIAWEGDTYTYPLGEAAIESALQYAVPRIKRWRIPVDRVVTHHQIAPTRKNDIARRDAELFRRRLKEALN